MQKKLIALAVAGLVSGAAFAQSNVQVYGVADGYYGYVKAGNAKVNPAFNSGGLAGSRLGFQGSEDLGNGLKAVFQYELAFNLDNTGGGINGAGGANGINNTRQSYVGLGGGFGTVVLGRLQSPGYYVGKFDALASSQISPQAILSGWGGMIGGTTVNATIAPNNNGRVNNAIAYLSPSFSGFSGVLAYAAGEQATGCTGCLDKEGVAALGLNYETGPLAVGFVHHRISNFLGNAALDARENMIGASYDLKMVKILGSYQDAKLDNTDKNKIWQIGVVVPVGPGSINVAYGKLSAGTKTLAGDVSDRDSKSWTAAYLYGFSKRTTGYAGYNRTTNDANGHVGILGVNPGNGEKTTGIVVGLNHKF